jgi:imidazole glycerol phosphate synthase glutamine amidotransferase subunit
MERLHAMGMVEVVRARFRENRPTMAICVGLQVLCESSEESPGVTGLGILPTTVRRFPNSVRVPQLGWNRIEAEEGCRYLRTGFCYFANSYHATAVPAGWKAAMADHGGPFVAGLERGATLACQFHPELSGAHGKELLARWLAESPKEAARC